MSRLLIMTVGTGTAGVHSNLAKGLARSVELIAPRALWLVASTSEDSQTIAELVAESAASSFCPVSDESRFHTIPQPDDMECCRRSIRAAIAHARRHLRGDERLAINPTSGTKQMSAGAVVAALDEGIGDIVFTVGNRADGVVITGTERLAAFDPGAYQRERALAQARDLAAAGAYLGAARILRPHRALLPRAHATALLLHHWQRSDYRNAADAASGHREDLRAKLMPRGEAAASGAPSPLVLGDLLAWADISLEHGDAPEALALAYKAIEYTARLAFTQRSQLLPDSLGCYHIDDLHALGLSKATLGRCRPRGGGETPLGVSLLVDALVDLDHPFGHACTRNPELRRLMETRNALVHDIRPVGLVEAQASLVCVRDALNKGEISLEDVWLPTHLSAD